MNRLPGMARIRCSPSTPGRAGARPGIARIGAALRRRREPAAFVHGELAIHYESREVTLRGESADLTATEFALLRELSQDGPQAVALPGFDGVR